jgi:hypothetical protein
MSVPSAPPAAVLLERARRLLEEARRAPSPGDRFCLAHLAALRIAAAVVAERGRPARSRGRIVNAWLLLQRVAPEYDRWATYFAAGAATRSAVEAGAASAVKADAADEQLRVASQFLHLAESSLGQLAA